MSILHRTTREQRPGPVYAWRLFQYDAKSNMLRSFVVAAAWPETTRIAHHLGPAFHRAPKSHCQCGLYGFYYPIFATGTPVLALFQAEGKTLFHVEGVRTRQATLRWIGVNTMGPVVLDQHIQLVQSLIARYHIPADALNLDVPYPNVPSDHEVTKGRLEAVYRHRVDISDGRLPPWEHVAFTCPASVITQVSAEYLEQMAQIKKGLPS